MHTTITGSDFQEMLLYGAAAINKEKQSINDLNVFPVPDGDTGTNMSLTMQAAATELKKRTPATIELASSITASALLRGARGNSGVILSLLFRGISKSLKGCVLADGAALGFNFTEKKVAPVLSVATGKTVTLGENGTVAVKVSAADGIRPKGGVHVLTASDGAFADANVSLASGAPNWVKGVSVADGEIVLEVKPRGFMLIVK